MYNNKQFMARLNAEDVTNTRQAAEGAEERVRTARREFLKLFGYGAAALSMGGLSLGEDGVPQLVSNAYAKSNKKSPYEKAFGFAHNLLYMNIGTTGASPRQVVQDCNDDYVDIASNPTAYFFGQQVMRNTIAPGFGCDPYELVLSFNTTDGLWRIVMGIPFQPGDEVITTNMEEDAGISATKILRDRFGVVLKTVNLPTNDAYSDQEVLDRFAAELTPNTKAILFSSPIYLTGARLPAKELCLWAAANNVISIVDGAHLPGMCTLDLHDMGCDFFSGAGHKWQCGPGQTGFLYIRNGFDPNPQVLLRPTGDMAPFGVPSPMVEIAVPGYTNTNPLPTYYPTNTLIYGAAGILANGVRNPVHNIAAVLQLVGNGSRPAQKALTQCCTMWDAWGRQAIEDYIVSLAQYLRARIVDIWGPQCLSIPYDDPAETAGRTGLTSFNPFSPGYDYNAILSVADSKAQKKASGDAVTALKNNYDIVIRNNSVPHSLRDHPTQNAASGTFSTPLRISTHLFHSLDDVDRVIDALLQVVPHP
ncbi:MAG: aminotransferase class V-fold PLP-dependent enzyme [Chromatiaceae bacterium]